MTSKSIQYISKRPSKAHTSDEDLIKVEWWDNIRKDIDKKWLGGVSEEDYMRYHLLPLSEFEQIYKDLEKQFIAKKSLYENNITYLNRLANGRFNNMEKSWGDTPTIKKEMQTLKDKINEILGLEINDISPATTKDIYNYNLEQAIPTAILTAIPLQSNPELTKTQSKIRQK